MRKKNAPLGGSNLKPSVHKVPFSSIIKNNFVSLIAFIDLKSNFFLREFSVGSEVPLRYHASVTRLPFSWHCFCLQKGLFSSECCIWILETDLFFHYRCRPFYACRSLQNEWIGRQSLSVRSLTRFSDLFQRHECCLTRSSNIFRFIGISVYSQVLASAFYLEQALFPTTPSKYSWGVHAVRFDVH